MSGFKVNFSVNNQLATPSIHAAPFAQRPAAGQPGRVFIDTDSPSTGIYRDTGTTWIQIAGTGGGGGTLQTVTDAGNTTTNDVAIGTSGAPSAPLDVHGAGVVAILQGTGTNDSFLQFNKSGNGKFKIGNVHNSGNDYFSVYNLQENSDAILVNISTNNVAIGGGTVAPSYRLDITGSLRNSGDAYLATSGGSVGIGTTSVTNGILQLTTTSTGDVVYINRGSNYIKLGGLASGTGSYVAAYEGEFQFKNVYNGDLSFYNNNIYRGKFAISTGNFLINISSDAGFKLDVNGNTRSSKLLINGTSITGSNVFEVRGTSGMFGDTYVISNSSSNNVLTVFSNSLAATFFNIVSSGNTAYFNNTIGYDIRISGTPVLALGTTETRFNSPGGNVDFAIQGDTNSNLFFLDASADNIGIGTNTPNANSMLDVVSTTKGVKFPSMTTAQKNAIANTAGLVVFDTDLDKLCVNSGAGWETITSV